MTQLLKSLLYICLPVSHFRELSHSKQPQLPFQTSIWIVSMCLHSSAPEAEDTSVWCSYSLLWDGEACGLFGISAPLLRTNFKASWDASVPVSGNHLIWALCVCVCVWMYIWACASLHLDFHSKMTALDMLVCLHTHIKHA